MLELFKMVVSKLNMYFFGEEVISRGDGAWFYGTLLFMVFCAFTVLLFTV